MSLTCDLGLNHRRTIPHGLGYTCGKKRMDAMQNKTGCKSSLVMETLLRQDDNLRESEDGVSRLSVTKRQPRRPGPDLSPLRESPITQANPSAGNDFCTEDCESVGRWKNTPNLADRTTRKEPGCASSLAQDRTKGLIQNTKVIGDRECHDGNEESSSTQPPLESGMTPPTSLGDGPIARADRGSNIPKIKLKIKTNGEAVLRKRQVYGHENTAKQKTHGRNFDASSQSAEGKISPQPQASSMSPKKSALPGPRNVSKEDQSRGEGSPRRTIHASDEIQATLPITSNQLKITLNEQAFDEDGACSSVYVAALEAKKATGSLKSTDSPSNQLKARLTRNLSEHSLPTAPQSPDPLAMESCCDEATGQIPATTLQVSLGRRPDSPPPSARSSVSAGMNPQNQDGHNQQRHEERVRKRRKDIGVKRGPQKRTRERMLKASQDREVVDRARPGQEGEG